MEHRRTALLHFAALAALAALAGCQKIGDEIDRLTVKPKPPPPTPKVEYVQPADTTPVDPDPTDWDKAKRILADRLAWNAAGDEARNDACRAVVKLAPDFVFKSLEEFGEGESRNHVGLFEHKKTGLEFSLCPGGRFTMGSPESEKGRGKDEPATEVTLTSAFLISRTEVTQRAWATIIAENPSTFPGEDRPVDNVNAYKADRFCVRARLTLPTEAQWEYACRAGTQTRFCFGDKSSELGDWGWFEENSDKMTHPVGLKKPNGFGLYDAHGNVWEWCRGGFHVYPESGKAVDPQGASGADMHRAVRGGAWQNPGATTGRSAFRYPSHPGDAHPGLGFRAAKTLDIK